MMATNPLGYSASKKALRLDRGEFFGGDPYAHLPKKKSRSPEVKADDKVPSFGYVGANYLSSRVLLLAIHPGEGPSEQTSSDERLYKALRRFSKNPSKETYRRATQVYREECIGWSIWKKHCKKVLRGGELTEDEIAYSNCIPWRTKSNLYVSSQIIKGAWKNFVHPLISELEPRIVVAMSKGVSKIISGSFDGSIQLITWNGASAANQEVLNERADAISKLRKARGLV